MTWVTLLTLAVAAAEPLKARAPSVKSNEKIVVKTQGLEGLGEGFRIKTDKWTWAYLHPIPSKSTVRLHQAKIMEPQTPNINTCKFNSIYCERDDADYIAVLQMHGPR